MQSTRPAEFIALIAFLTALMAMSIDAMLPGLGIMAQELGAVHDNDRQLVIIGFFAGQMLGLPIFGPLSDSIGRKPSIYAGLAIFIAGALLCMVATSFPVLVAGRLIQGLGSAGPRIVALAMVRDGAKGAAMARIMSFVMSVFMLVPIFAPSLGQLALHVANWRYIFGGLIVAALIAGTWLATRQSETLAPENRRPFSAAALWDAAGQVVRHPISMGYTVTTGFVFSVWTAYLGVCQQIFADQYHQGERFALWFGGFAIFLAVAMIANGKLVGKLGMRNLSRKAMYFYVVVWLLILLSCLLTSGQPPLWLVAVLFAGWFISAGFTFGNFNAMAMEPMGHIAGMAAAISGTISQFIGILMGGIAGRFYDGTLTPLAMFFAAFAVISLVLMEWTESRRPAKVAATASPDTQ